MPKYTLTKDSSPGWERDFYDKETLRQELYKHICNQCRCEEGITEQSTISDMLVTACGCEFLTDGEL